jgi:uncharacterized membrane protein YdjX (TVP38/TMEM64 family)
MTERNASSQLAKISWKTGLKTVLVILVIGLIIAGASALIGRYFNPETSPLVAAIVRERYYAATFYYLYTVLASIVVPIPTLPIDVVLLNIFNPWIVMVIRLAGGLTGGSVGFYLARRYGRPLLKRWLSKKNFDYSVSLSENVNWKQFFIISMIPIINTEIMAYAGGLSRLQYRWVIGVLALALAYRIFFVSFVIHL